MKFLLSLTATLSIISSSSSSPVSILIIILTQTLILSFIMWMTINSSWTALILFLIFMGGLMVLFIYITSLAPNDKFFDSFKSSLKWMILFSLAALYFMSSPDSEFTKMDFLNNINFMILYPSMKLIFFCMTYLLLTLVIVIKICNKFDGPIKTTKI